MLILSSASEMQHDRDIQQRTLMHHIDSWLCGAQISHRCNSILGDVHVEDRWSACSSLPSVISFFVEATLPGSQSFCFADNMALVLFTILPMNQGDKPADVLESAVWVATNESPDSDIELAFAGDDPNDPLVSAVRAIMNNR